jgi:hypothetical protein
MLKIFFYITMHFSFFDSLLAGGGALGLCCKDDHNIHTHQLSSHIEAGNGQQEIRSQSLIGPRTATRQAKNMIKMLGMNHACVLLDDHAFNLAWLFRASKRA